LHQTLLFVYLLGLRPESKQLYTYSHLCYYMYFLGSIEAVLHDTLWTFGIATATHRGMLSPTLSRHFRLSP